LPTRELATVGSHRERGVGGAGAARGRRRRRAGPLRVARDDGDVGEACPLVRRGRACVVRERGAWSRVAWSRAA
jgi:hypothetical protein